MKVFLIVLVCFIVFIVLVKYMIKYFNGRKLVIENLKSATQQIALFLSDYDENKQIKNILNGDYPCYENYLYRTFYFHATWTHKHIWGEKTQLPKNALYFMAKCICNTPELLTSFYENFIILMRIYGRIIGDKKLENMKIEKTKEQVAKDLLNIVLFYN